MRENVVEMLRYFDRKAYREKLLAISLQFTTLIFANAVVGLLYLSPPFAHTAALVLSTGVAMLITLQLVFNFGSRWEQYRLFRYEAFKLLADFELRAETPDQAEEALVDITSKFRELLKLQESLWFTGDPVVLDKIMGSRERSAK